jgi:hypothetical protein
MLSLGQEESAYAASVQNWELPCPQTSIDISPLPRETQDDHSRNLKLWNRVPQVLRIVLRLCPAGRL